MIAALVMVSCSSDREDMPEVPDKDNVYPTQEEYQNKIANKLWVIKERKWVDEDGNVMPELVGEGGFGDADAYYFLDEGFIYFSGTSPCSRKSEFKYDEETGCFYSPEIDRIMICPQFLSFGDNEIIMKNYVGMYRDDANSPIREDVWRYQKYVLEENPDWEYLLGSHYPEDYNPEDYGMK